MNKILSVNAGSSSLKFQLLSMPSERVIVEGIVERIGNADAIYTVKLNGNKERTTLSIKNHSEAIQLVLNDLIKRQIVASLDEIKGVGHRVVHGGEKFKESTIITPEVIKQIEEVSFLAPLHNPGAITGIKAFQEALPNVVHVAVFDTAFHQTMEPEAYMYAVPYEWYEKYGVRKYGFHGTSHQYVSMKAAELMGKPYEESKIITVHLGNGASLAAIKNGKCIDTSMGMTPLEGIPMGTRSGTIDPAIIEFICTKENKTVQQVLEDLNKRSGYLGISGLSNDSRDLEDAAAEGHYRSNLALDIQYKRIADYIGSYYVYLGGADAIVFTAGIGENNARCREVVCDRISALGVKIDYDLNNRVRGVVTELSTPDSKIRVFLIPTNEELMIARDTMRLAKL
ncbi:MAG TPA: acetate kinase [Bacilli bacterium]|nr:acetate kinase [Bacilli bacterium]HQD92621.1 acetate kinase [Bacilli bacterium]